jgi:hypothetical protein
MGWPVSFLRKEHVMATDLKFDGTFLEAPASWNVRYASQEGYICQLTLRANSGKDLLEKAGVALSFLLEHGNSPSDNNNNHHSNGDTKLCPIHKVGMKRREKDGKSWFSHKLEDGNWCRGKQQIEGGKS